LDWVDELEKEGLDVYLQSLAFRAWMEIRIEGSTLFMNLPVLHDFQVASPERKRELLRDLEFRRAAREAYKPEYFVMLGGGCEKYILANAHGSLRFKRYENRRIQDIAEAEGCHVVDAFFDILDETDLAADFKLEEARSLYIELMTQSLRHPRVIPGTSDGGAHSKMISFGHWPVDMLMWYCKEERKLSLEELHHILSHRMATAFGFKDNGLIKPGNSADIVVYDYNRLGYCISYSTVADLPGGEWRRISPPSTGIKYIIVNGQVSIEDGEPNGVLAGRVIDNAASHARAVN
jgi:N-acyl-D-aspartate/D-glutamate deacylase